MNILPSIIVVSYSCQDCSQYLLEYSFSHWQLLLTKTLFVAVIFGQSAYSHPDSPPDFTAEITQFNQLYPNEILQSRVFFSSHGIRLQKADMFGHQQAGWYVQDFANSRSWLVRPEKRIFTELLPDDEFEEDDASIDEPGLMSTQVCDFGGLIAKQKLGNETLQGYATEIWRCAFKTLVVIQNFSPKLGMVIREEWPGDLVAELRNIEQELFSREFFRPPAGFSKVTSEGFFLGRKRLPAFQE